LFTGVTTTLVSFLSNAAVEDTAVVVACSYLFRSLGSSIGISTSSAVLQQVLRTQLTLRLGDGDKVGEIIDRVRENLDVIKELPPKVAEQVRESYQVATLGAVASISVYLILAFVVTFFIKEKIIQR
jgi:ABC-type bacteriocin/lantibiotic exporter with double-glycine peptidase domain